MSVFQISGFIFAAVAIAQYPQTAEASTIFSNLTAGNTYNNILGGLDVTSPVFSDPSDPHSDVLSGQAVAELFTSNGNYSVTQIDVGLVGSGAAVISLWTDNSGQPGTELGD